jgi:hypothetical protein
MKIQAQALLLGATTAIAWGWISVAPGHAINLIGNLPSNDGGVTILSSGSGTNVKAVSFTLPTGTDYILENAVLRLGNYDSTDVFQVQIRNDTGGLNPGSTVLANFTLPGFQGSGNFNYAFTPATAFTFQQNTKYWLYVDISPGSGGSGAINWLRSDPSVTPTGEASFGAYRVGRQIGGQTTFGGSTALNSFQVNATAVPWETDALPVIGSTVLFGLGLWGKNKFAQRKIDNLKQ